MTARSITHGTFTLERSYDASPARVYNAFADPEIKARWFAGPEEWQAGEQKVDFRVGGREINQGGPKGGPVHTFECLYQDIVPNERIVYTYDMLMEQTRISVSLACLEFKAEGTGTRLVLTEHGAFLDGHDTPDQRAEGTEGLLDALGAELSRQAAES